MKPENLKIQAELGYQNGDLAAAVTACQDAIKINPSQASLYGLLGQLLWDMGKTAAAQRCYEQWRQMPPEIITINPEAVAYFDKGNTLAGEGKLSEAVASYEQALQLEHNYTSAWVNLGIIQRKQGNLDEAIGCYRRACAVKPNLVDAYYSLSNAWAEKGEIQAAISCCIQALEIKPDFEQAYLNLQYLLMQQGKIESAFPCALHILPVEVLQEFYPEPVPFAEIISDGGSICPYVHTSTTIYLTPPKTIDENVHRSFNWRRYIYPSTFIAQLPGGRAWGDAYTAAVITADNKLLSEVARGSAELIFTSRKLPHPTHIEGNLAFLSVRGGNTYYHWMADLLPKLELLHLGGIDRSQIDYFAVNGYDLAYQRQSLELLGIEPHKIIPSSQYPHLTAKNLIVPSLPGNQGIMTQWGAEFLRRQFLPAAAVNGNWPEKIYISRENASYRRVVNEKEVVDFLLTWGFVCVRMEMISLAEQVAMFAGAKVIVAPHGAGLTNTVFCQPGTKVIEMFARQSVSINYWLIAQLVGIDYYYLLGDSLGEYYLQRGEEKPLCNHPLYDDIYVNMAVLAEILRLAGVVS